MEILNLHLANFRNFSSKKIVFDKGLTVLIGPNGSGKSNILEAIGLFSGIRPVKIDTDFDLVKFGESEVKIEVKVFDWNQDKVLTINMIVSDERYVRKAYFIDSVKKRLADLSLSLSVVIFSPQDLELVTGIIWTISFHRQTESITAVLMRITKLSPEEIKFCSELPRENQGQGNLIFGMSDYWNMVDIFLKSVWSFSSF